MHGSKERPTDAGPGNILMASRAYERIIVAVEAEGRPAVQQHTAIETVLNMTPENKEHFQSEKEAIFLLLTGIGDEIYSTVDACNTANEMWIAIERLQQGESLNVQDVKTNLFWEFGKFTSRDGESMESYYSRFYKLMNELTRNNLQVTTMQVNVQFLQQLQPEWSRFVTLVKQSEKIDTISYHRLFDILKQFQKEVNDIRAERIAKSANPLALLAAAQPYSDTYYQAPKPQRSNATSSSTRQSASTRHKGKEVAKPITPQSESVSEEDSDPEQAQRDKEMQKNLALLAKYFKKLYKPTNNNLRTSSNSRNKTEDTTPRYNNDNQSRQFGNQRTMTVAGARETVGSQVVQQTGIQCFNCKGYGHYAKECRKPKRVKDYAYHKEKMMMCKQAEQGVPLQAEQADWLEDTDEEIDEQELEAHYSYMAKIQEVSPEESSSTGQPLEQVQNHDESNVYDNVRRHSEQPESINDTYVLKKDDSNVTPDSSNICTNDNQVDQNAAECVDERAALANLIANLTLDTEENKTILKQLKKANASLTQELEKCKTNLDETNSALGEAISCRDSCLIALQNKQNEFEKYKAFNDRTIDYEILQTKLNETLGLLALKDIEIKEGLKTKAYEISVLNQKHDELVKKSLLTKSQLEGYLKENTKVISDLKVKEDKDIDKMIEMDKQLKFLNEIVYTRNQSIQTIHMLAPKCSTYNGRPTFANPRYLKKAQSEKPCLYEIPYDTSDPANRFAPDREETMTLDNESRSKLNKDYVKPYDYTKQNSLYEIFKAPSLEYLYQLERAKEVRKTMWRKPFVRTKPNIAKNVAFLPVSESISKSRQVFNDMTFNINQFIEIVDQTWRKHTSSCFRVPTAHDMELLIKTLLMPLSIKSQNDSFRFEHELKTEMHEDFEYVKSLEKEIDELESEKADFSNMYDLLLEECVSKDIICSYLHSLSELNAHTELQCMYLHKVKECECLAQKLSKQTEFVNNEVHNKLLKSFAKLENTRISVTACNDSSNSRTSNENAVCAECGTCVFNSNHDACVSRYLKDVNARTKKPNVVPISASKPKRKANKSVATPHKKTVASDTHYSEIIELLTEFIVHCILFIVDSWSAQSTDGQSQVNVTIKRVYSSKAFNHNLFSLSILDAELDASFRNLHETTSSTPSVSWLIALPTQAWLWHREGFSSLTSINITILSKKSKKNFIQDKAILDSKEAKFASHGTGWTNARCKDTNGKKMISKTSHDDQTAIFKLKLLLTVLYKTHEVHEQDTPMLISKKKALNIILPLLEHLNRTALSKDGTVLLLRLLERCFQLPIIHISFWAESSCNLSVYSLRTDHHAISPSWIRRQITS
ncbi:retrovirus-related pol polyprotein from transposon TNT 1-94 [Tanacetum coccineum]|uniref:Retrovirus-related pol polyprotein from transposon TNT 1-94 n=1 Tax=Tanacetum coccineum TaxID=301880 RepID=A0ABQ4YZ44_9ASTR